MTSSERARLEAEIAALAAALAATRAENTDLRRSVTQRDQDIALLKLKVDQLLHRIFGRSSEKAAPGQLGLLGELPEPPQEEPAGEEEEAEEEPPPDAPRKRRGGRRRLSKDLPRERLEHDVPESERGCPCCGGTMERFGEDVTEELDFVPARFLLREHVRPKYARRKCQEGVKQADLPPRPIEKGRPGPGLLAHVLVSKYVDHLPLYRQTRIFERHGVELHRSTMCDWVRACAETLRPIVELLKREVLRSPVMQADETPLLVLERRGSAGPRRHLGYLWVYRGMEGETVYEYRPTRGAEGPLEFLKGFSGKLQTDGYSAYDGLSPGIVEVGCWAHARRKLVAAEASAPGKAKEAVDLVRKLYLVERRARGRPPEERAALRREKAAPVLEALRGKLETWRPEVLPKSPLGEAIGYALRQWPTLDRYLDDGEVEIDNNAIERAIRPVAVGRKNYLFCGSEEGARRAATLYSLIESCKAVGVEPFAYFADVLARTATASARELLPRAWKAARDAAQAAAPKA